MNLLAASAPLLHLALAPMAGRSDNVVVIWILGFAGVAVIFNQVAAAWITLTRGLNERPAPSQSYAT